MWMARGSPVSWVLGAASATEFWLMLLCVMVIGFVLLAYAHTAKPDLRRVTRYVRALAGRVAPNRWAA
jgi:hypothetical protein